MAILTAQWKDWRSAAKDITRLLDHCDECKIPVRNGLTCLEGDVDGNLEEGLDVG